MIMQGNESSYVGLLSVILLNSAFTTAADSDTISPGLVEDGNKCGSGKFCQGQRCVDISSLGLPQCPTDSEGNTCSGNGVTIIM